MKKHRGTMLLLGTVLSYCNYQMFITNVFKKEEDGFEIQLMKLCISSGNIDVENHCCLLDRRIQFDESVIHSLEFLGSKKPFSIS